MNGYEFTQRVRKVLAMAREQAANHLNHEYVATEHILLAILAEGEGVASTVLQKIGIDSDALRSSVLNMVKPGRGRPTGPDVPYTSGAKKTLELGMSEARHLNHSCVGTEHLLLGLLGEAKGVGARALAGAGVTLEQARAELIRILIEPPFPRTIEPGTSPRDRAVIEFVARNTTARHLFQSAQRFDEIIRAAHALAVEHQSRIILPSHLTIALLQHPGGLANAALGRLDFDRAAVLAALNDVALEGSPPGDPKDGVKLAPESETAFLAAEKLRSQSNAATAGTHHLLLALIMTAPDVDSVFAKQNVNADMIRESVRWLSG